MGVYQVHARIDGHTYCGTCLQDTCGIIHAPAELNNVIKMEPAPPERSHCTHTHPTAGEPIAEGDTRGFELFVYCLPD